MPIQKHPTFCNCPICCIKRRERNRWQEKAARKETPKKGPTRNIHLDSQSGETTRCASPLGKLNHESTREDAAMHLPKGKVGSNPAESKEFFRPEEGYFHPKPYPCVRNSAGGILIPVVGKAYRWSVRGSVPITVYFIRLNDHQNKFAEVENDLGKQYTVRVADLTEVP